MEPRSQAAVIAGVRMAIGAAALGAPGPVSRAMLGREGGGGTTLFVRMLGGRDLALGLGVVLALRRSAPVRSWLEAAAVADAADFVACLLARDHIPRPVAVGTAGSAAGATVLGAWLSRQV